jgi:hypothetical protein
MFQPGDRVVRLIETTGISPQHNEHQERPMARFTGKRGITGWSGASGVIALIGAVLLFGCSKAEKTDDSRKSRDGKKSGGQEARADVKGDGEPHARKGPPGGRVGPGDRDAGVKPRAGTAKPAGGLAIGFGIGGWDRGNRCCMDTTFVKNDPRAGVYVELPALSGIKPWRVSQHRPFFLSNGAPVVIARFLKKGPLAEQYAKAYTGKIDVYDRSRRLCTGHFDKFAVVYHAELHHSAMVEWENDVGELKRSLRHKAAWGVLRRTKSVMTGHVAGCVVRKLPKFPWARSASLGRPALYTVGSGPKFASLRKEAGERLRRSQTFRRLKKKVEAETKKKAAVHLSIQVMQPPAGKTGPVLVAGEAVVDDGDEGIQCGVGYAMWRLWVVESGKWHVAGRRKDPSMIRLVGDLDGDGKLEIVVQDRPPKHSMPPNKITLYRLDQRRLKRERVSKYPRGEHHCG